MKKVISFSLYGNNEIYTIGCIENAILLKSLFKGWQMWVYYNNSVPESILEKLKCLNVKLIHMSDNNSYANSIWRFMPIKDDSVEYFISRDCDSRISIRDEIAVNEFLNSNEKFHIIRDHPIGHGWPINGGLWGAKGGSIENFEKLLELYLKNNTNIYNKYIDQFFLKDVVYPFCVNNAFVHDEYFNFEKNRNKIKRDRLLDDFHFIGESVDEKGLPRGEQRDPIKKIYYSL